MRGKLLRQPRAQDVHLGLSLRQRNAWLNPSDPDQHTRTGLQHARSEQRVLCDRNPHVLTGSAVRIAKACRQDSHNGEGTHIQSDGLANNSRIGTEAAAPQVLAQNSYRCRAWLAILGQQCAAGQRDCVQQRKYLRRHRRGVHNRGLARPGQREIVKRISCHLAKHTVLLAALGEVPVGKTGKSVWLLQRDIEHQDELIGVRIRKGSQKHRIHDTENRCIGADAESKSEDGDGREAQILPQNSGSVADILPRCLQSGEGGHLARDLL